MIKLECKYPWIIYDGETIPNEFRCLICGEKLVILTPVRWSSYLILGDKFAEQHKH